MQNWSNPPTDMPLEDVVRELNDNPGSYNYVERVGFEVTGEGHRKGERHTLQPQFDIIGFYPSTGELIQASGLGLGSQWRVEAVAIGYPGSMKIYTDYR